MASESNTHFRIGRDVDLRGPDTSHPTCPPATGSASCPPRLRPPHLASSQFWTVLALCPEGWDLWYTKETLPPSIPTSKQAGKNNNPESDAAFMNCIPQEDSQKVPICSAGGQNLLFQDQEPGMTVPTVQAHRQIGQLCDAFGSGYRHQFTDLHLLRKPVVSFKEREPSAGTLAQRSPHLRDRATEGSLL